MTGRAPPGRCATRTDPCFPSNRDFDTYTTFDILPPSRFFQPIPKWERRYSSDPAGFIKYLDKVATVVVISPMLARRLHHSPRRKSFPCIALRTLDLSLRSFSDSRPLFSTPSALFLQNTRVAYVPVSTFFSTPFRLRRHMRHVAPLFPVASVDCAYFPSPRGCAPQTHSTLCSNRNLLALCFHTLTNPFFPNPFPFTSIQNPGGVTPRQTEGIRTPWLSLLESALMKTPGMAYAMLSAPPFASGGTCIPWRAGQLPNAFRYRAR